MVVDIGYGVTLLGGSGQHLYGNVYCQCGQMENVNWERGAART
jgi:hypothetical protein